MNEKYKNYKNYSINSIKDYMLTNNIFSYKIDLNMCMPSICTYFEETNTNKGSPLYTYRNSLNNLIDTIHALHLELLRNSQIENPDFTIIKTKTEDFLRKWLEHIDHCKECISMYNKHSAIQFYHNFKTNFKDQLGNIVNAIKHPGNQLVIFKLANQFGYSIYGTSENSICLNKNIHPESDNGRGFSIYRQLKYSIVSIYEIDHLMKKSLNLENIKYSNNNKLTELINEFSQSSQLEICFKNEEMYPYPDFEVHDNEVLLQLMNINSIPSTRRPTVIIKTMSLTYTIPMFEKGKLYEWPH